MARGNSPEQILYGNFTRLSNDKQLEGIPLDPELYRAAVSRGSQPLSFKQFQSIAHSKAIKPMWAKRFRLTEEQIRQCKRGGSKYDYNRFFADLYPPGTRIEFIQFYNPQSGAVNLPGSPKTGEQGTIARYNLRARQIIIDWDSHKVATPLIFGDQFQII